MSDWICLKAGGAESLAEALQATTPCRLEKGQVVSVEERACVDYSGGDDDDLLTTVD